MKNFQEIFGRPAAVIASAPGRVNLLGEHTDYNDGLVLPSALGLRTTVSLGRGGEHRGGDHTFRVYSATLDELSSFTLADLPASPFARYVYGCLKEFAAFAGALPPLDLHIGSRVPMGAGLSSSAALEVALLRALREMLGGGLDDVEIAQMARRAEVEYAGVHCGIMDQMAASLSVEGTMLFLDTRSLERAVLSLPVGGDILVMHCGLARSLQQSGYNLRRDECRQAAALLGLPSLRDAVLDDVARLPPSLGRRVRHVVSENERVRAAQKADAAAFGALMNASHASLRDDFEVSVPALDALVAYLQADPDVFGAKLTGAGFGGACVALARRGRLADIAAAVIGRYQQAPQPYVLVP